MSLNTRNDIRKAALDISTRRDKNTYAEATKFLLQAVTREPAMVTEYLSIITAEDARIQAPIIRRALRKMAEVTGQDGLINIWSSAFIPAAIDEY